MINEASYDCPSCGEEITVEMEIDEGGIEGSDADGNRGVYYGPSAIAPEPFPVCQYCQHTLTEEETAAIQTRLNQFARDWHPDEPDPPEFDDWQYDREDY